MASLEGFDTLCSRTRREQFQVFQLECINLCMTVKAKKKNIRKNNEKKNRQISWQKKKGKIGEKKQNLSKPSNLELIMKLLTVSYEQNSFPNEILQLNIDQRS